MASLLLPVFTIIQPYLLESAIRHTMRQRAWVFSLASPVNSPLQGLESTRSKASKGSRMLMI